MGLTEIQKVIVVPPEHPVLDYLKDEPDLIETSATPFSIHDIISSCSWKYYLDGRLLSYRVFIPSFVFFHDGSILVRKNEKNYSIWFGRPITQRDVLKQSETGNILFNYLDDINIDEATSRLDVLGYCCYKAGRASDEFLIVSLVDINIITSLGPFKSMKNKEWYNSENITEVYFHLDVLSKKIYDYIYEDEGLRKIYLKGS